MMKLLRKVMSITLSISIALIFIFNNTTYASTQKINPPREEIEKKIEEIAREKGIPSVILKSIARVESLYQQFKPDGSVFRGSMGEIGLMQIYNRSGYYDSNRLKYDIEYNIEVSADILLSKWNNYGSIGNMDPNILENWYFAIWAYNGWASVNNPNTGKKINTYQELVYAVAEEEYGQKITPVDTSLLPQTGTPDRDIHIETPQPVHYGDIREYYQGDLLEVEVGNNLTVRNTPGGEINGHYIDGTVVEVIEGPELADGRYWYKVIDRTTSLKGWVAGNWVKKVGTIYPFDDISRSWAKDYIVKLSEMNVISGSSDGNYYPDQPISNESMSILLAKALSLDSEGFDLTYNDSVLISPWAKEYVKAISKANIITGNHEFHLFNPQESITREEMAIIIEKAFKYMDEKKESKEDSISEKDVTNKDDDKSVDGEYEQSASTEESIKDYLDYDDVDEISLNAIKAVKFAKEMGILEGKNGMFKPNEYITKAEASKIMVEIIEKIDKDESTN